MTGKLFSRKGKAAGLPPGTPVHVGSKKQTKTFITVFDFDQERYEEKTIKRIDECFPFRDKPSITWINVDGLQELDIIEQIDKHFGIHPLVLEDIVNTSQRPKIDDYEDYIYIVVKMLTYNKEKDEIESEQISLILGNNCVISFQETVGDIFDPIRDRIRNNKGRVRKQGADYLAYVLLDCIVDQYFAILEHLGDKIESLEDELSERWNPQMSLRIHQRKKDMIFLRKQIWPLREVISGFQRSESKLVKKTTGIFLRDMYDHTIQVIDTIESFRDTLAGLQDIYLASISNRMNEIMKVLTIFTSVFIPLNFIAGVYGMNFKYMPELEWRWGYYDALGLMALIALAMLIYFKQRKWF